MFWSWDVSDGGAWAGLRWARWARGLVGGLGWARGWAGVGSSGRDLGQKIAIFAISPFLEL